MKRKQHLFMPIFILLHFLFISFNCNAQLLRKRTTLLMGGRFDISIVAEDSLKAENSINSIIREITRIEELISDWKTTSQVSEVNRNAGICPVKVDREVFELTQRAIHFSVITNGAFDITFAAMDKIWKFDGSMTTMPSPDSIKKSITKVGYKNILLDSVQSTIFLKIKGMKIGFGALGEGYATDKCRKMMLTQGIQAGIVNASGDITTWGTQPNGDHWNIGITNPFHNNKLLGTITLNQDAITTSGSYEKFVIFDGKRYSHIINPATGYPSNGLCNVTVIGPYAEKANGFSTSIMVLGKEAGMDLINNYPEYSCIIITDTGKIFKSKNFRNETFHYIDK